MVEPSKHHRRQGQSGAEDTAQTKPRMQGVPSSAPEPPGPMSDEDAAIDARVRLKQERDWTEKPHTGTGNLDAEERAYLARLPAASAVPPDAFEGPRKEDGRAREQIAPTDPRHVFGRKPDVDRDEKRD